MQEIECPSNGQRPDRNVVRISTEGLPVGAVALLSQPPAGRGGGRWWGEPEGERATLYEFDEHSRTEQGTVDLCLFSDGKMAIAALLNGDGTIWGQKCLIFWNLAEPERCDPGYALGPSGRAPPYRFSHLPRVQ